jgi:biopolymer transport protein ExbB
MQEKRVILAVFLVALVAFMACAGTLTAQEEDEGGAAPPSLTVGKVIKDGGPIGWVIILVSIISLSLIIEHFVSIRRDKLAPPEIVDQMHELFDQENYQEAIELCEAEPNIFTNVVGAALHRMSGGFEAMEAAVAEVGEEESVKLHQKISYLSLIGTIAPMLGLFGTVTGMILAFTIIAEKKGAADPGELAVGISQALVTTFLGLFVAIPTMVFFFYFRNKVVMLVLEVGALTGELFDKFRPTD